jgi:hypothetical protein
MPDKQTSKTKKKVSQSQRKHIRRLKAEARKTGVPYIASPRLVSTPKVTAPKAAPKEQ